MPNKHESEHISPEQLADYFSGELSEDEEATLEEHLAECAECAERARNVYGLSLVVDQWTARAHGEAYRRDLLVTALAQAEDNDVELAGAAPALARTLVGASRGGPGHSAGSAGRGMQPAH